MTMKAAAAAAAAAAAVAAEQPGTGRLHRAMEDDRD
jgi:hypothetical protein